MFLIIIGELLSLLLDYAKAYKLYAYQLSPVDKAAIIVIPHNNPPGISPYQAIVRNIFCQYASAGYRNVIAYLNRPGNNGARAYPDIISNHGDVGHFHLVANAYSNIVSYT